eukprot:SM000245S08191  [mRNA]  locus=s245:11846:20185:- [translate_table: standard]
MERERPGHLARLPLRVDQQQRALRRSGRELRDAPQAVTGREEHECHLMQPPPMTLLARIPPLHPVPSSLPPRTQPHNPRSLPQDLRPHSLVPPSSLAAAQLATESKASILAALPSKNAAQGAELFETIVADKGGLEGLLAAVQVQDPDRIAARLGATLDNIGQLEILQLLLSPPALPPLTNSGGGGRCGHWQAPGLPFSIPTKYADMPRLAGRATVEFTLVKADGGAFTVPEGGGQRDTGTMEVVLDGYSAPLTAGNFADMVLKNAYNGVPVRTTGQAVLTDAGAGVGHEIPLEIKPAGEFQPLYRTPLVVQDGELPVLPMSVYGAVAMSHSVDSDTSSSPSQFFFYLYDKRNSGLGGLTFDEGQFSVFGYVTKGRELLSQLRTGDVIQSAKLKDGHEHLVNTGGSDGRDSGTDVATAALTS